MSSYNVKSEGADVRTAENPGLENKAVNNDNSANNYNKKSKHKSKVGFWFYVLTVLAVLLGISAISDCDLSLYLLPYEKFHDFDASSPEPLSSTSSSPSPLPLPIHDKFKNDVVWITGGSSGIGAYLAKELTRSGAQVVISARREDKLNEVADECAKFGLRPTVLPLDVTQLDKHQAALDSIISIHGRVDSLVLNAGKSQRSPAVSTAFESTKEIFDLNFFSVVHLNKIVLNHFIANNKGHIVVVSSLSGRIGTPIASSYSATKFALHGYFDALRSEVSKTHNIHVSLVCPGPVVSEISQHTIRDPTLPVQSEGGKMSTSRCAYLMAKAMYYKFNEPWISDQPFLLATYISVYLPAVNRKLMTSVIGPSRIKTLTSGGDIWDIGSNFVGTSTK